MNKYMVLDCHPPLDAEFYALHVTEPAKSRRWAAGVLFSNSDRREGMHLPDEPIGVHATVEAEPPPRIFAELYWIPIPLMSRRLVAALRAAGVDNLQTFGTEFIDPPGASPPPHDHYLAVNIVGLVSAADLAKSEINPNVADRMVSTDFYSLAVDASEARDQLMFRLAENVSAVLVHECVKNALDADGFENLLTWFAPEEWAG